MPGSRRKRRSTRVRAGSSTKKRLAGFTKVKGKFALVFKKGKKLTLGKSRFGSKKMLISGARKFLK